MVIIIKNISYKRGPRHPSCNWAPQFLGPALPGHLLLLKPAVTLLKENYYFTQTEHMKKKRKNMPI